MREHKSSQPSEVERLARLVRRIVIIGLVVAGVAAVTLAFLFIGRGQGGRTEGLSVLANDPPSQDAFANTDRGLPSNTYEIGVHVHPGDTYLSPGSANQNSTLGPEFNLCEWAVLSNPLGGAKDDTLPHGSGAKNVRLTVPEPEGRAKYLWFGNCQPFTMES